MDKHIKLTTSSFTYLLELSYGKYFVILGSSNYLSSLVKVRAISRFFRFFPNVDVNEVDVRSGILRTRDQVESNGPS